MAKSRAPLTPAPRREWLAYPTLVILVAALVVFGALQYSLLLAVLSAVFVGFFGWLWWYRRQSAAAPPPPARKPARRRKSARRTR